jgi:hypothetical protein
VFADRDYERVLRSTTRFVASENSTAYLVNNVDDAFEPLELADKLIVDLDGPEGPAWELLLLATDTTMGYRLYPDLWTVVAFPSLCMTSSVRAMSMGVNAIMEKPVTFEIIRRAIFGRELTHVPAGGSGSMTVLEAADPGSHRG